MSVEPEDDKLAAEREDRKDWEDVDAREAQRDQDLKGSESSTIPFERTGIRPAEGRELLKRYLCPRCGRTSYHPQDAENGYCGFCHDFTGGIMQDDQEAAELDFWVNGVVAVRNGLPYLQLSTTQGMITQLTMSQARKIAFDMLLMCSRTEADAMLIRFLEGELKAPKEASIAMMQLFRDFRHELDMDKAEGKSGPEFEP